MDITFVRQQPIVEHEFKGDGFEQLLVLFEQLQRVAHLTSEAAGPPRVSESKCMLLPAHNPSPSTSPCTTHFLGTVIVATLTSRHVPVLCPQPSALK